MNIHLLLCFSICFLALHGYTHHQRLGTFLARMTTAISWIYGVNDLNAAVFIDWMKMDDFFHYWVTEFHLQMYFTLTACCTPLPPRWCHGPLIGCCWMRPAPARASSARTSVSRPARTWRTSSAAHTSRRSCCCLPLILCTSLTARTATLSTPLVPSWWGRGIYLVFYLIFSWGKVYLFIFYFWKKVFLFSFFF